MADLAALAETIANLTLKEARELSDILENEYNIEPAKGEHRMLEYSGAKIGASHESESFNKGFYAALAAYDEPEAPWARELFEIGINYLIGKTYAFGYRDGGVMEGACRGAREAGGSDHATVPGKEL